MKMNRELVIIAPTQIKKVLSVGNIYDLTIADFYAKARKFGGDIISIPLLWNVTGKPLIKQMQEDGVEITADKISEYVLTLISNAEAEMRDYYLDFDCSLRDDELATELSLLAKGNYSDTFNIGVCKVNECLNCGNIFGSDPLISSCKICGKKTIFHNRQTLFKHIIKKDITRKIFLIKFFPKSIEKKLSDFLGNVPNEYDLILEKNREYTLEYEGYQLDPRFIAMMFPAVLNMDSIYDMITFIHGDVVKKFDYYSLCYLNDRDMPTRIVSHGLLLDKYGKKLRWQESNNKERELFCNIDNKILRAYFLKHNIKSNLAINPEYLQEQTKGLVRIYVKIKKILEDRNRDVGATGIRNVLKHEVDVFNKSVLNFQLPNAFVCMNKYVDICWKIVKDKQLTNDEHNTLESFRNMYFGQ